MEISKPERPKRERKNTVTTAYGLKARTRLGMTEADAKVRDLLAAEGFGILTEIDIASIFDERVIDPINKEDANA